MLFSKIKHKIKNQHQFITSSTQHFETSIPNTAPPDEKINLFTEKVRQSLFLKRTERLYQQMMASLTDPAQLLTYINDYSDDELTGVIRRKNADGLSLLHSVHDQPESLALLLSALPLQQLKLALTEKNAWNETLFNHYVASPLIIEVLNSAYHQINRSANYCNEQNPCHLYGRR